MPRKEPVLLNRFYNESNLYEFALDEVGRGCLFGRVYIACVVLPKDPALFSGVDGTNIKDSKKFSSKKKLAEVAEYIKRNALTWHISWIESEEIDKINILKATMKGMHDCIDNIYAKIENSSNMIKPKISDCMAIVDGNYFQHYRRFDLSNNTISELPHITIEQGDAKYMGIAAASILAKNARDEWVLEMCQQYPLLVERYGLDTNMGYGTKRHLEGIKEHGISQWHRKTFGDLCKNSRVQEIDF
jgi:ribonuclease HII